MAKRRWNGMCARWLGAAAIGAAWVAGVPGSAWGQSAQPDATALVEAERLDREVLKLHGEGRYDAAVPLAEGLLAFREKVLGPSHPDVAISLNNLAALYDAKGDYARAEPLYQRALGIQEKALGPNHSDVARSLNNLALLYQAKGDYARAEPLLRRALGIQEKALGPTIPTWPPRSTTLRGCTH